MPEGPEILITAQYLATKVRKREIEEIEILSGKYSRTGIKGQSLINQTPLTINSIDSKGKFMWFDMTDKNGKKLFMLNTFGLTGRWSFNKDNNSRIGFSMRSNSDKSKMYHMYFIDNINYGTIEFTDNESVLQSKLDKLAPDLLKSNISNDQIVHRFNQIKSKSRKDLNLVKILMDQELIVSGIGNYLVAEILYDAKLNPHRKLNELSHVELMRLAQSMRKVAKYAYYNNNSGYMEYFPDFMKTHSEKIDNGDFPDYQPDVVIPENEHFVFNVYQKKYDQSGNLIQKDEIVKGRTIHWVPDVQK
jgi:formamidopyrimidine-DNA glycosylase